MASDTDVVPRLWIRHTSDTPGLAVLISAMTVTVTAGVVLSCLVSWWYVDDDEGEEEEEDDDEDEEEEEEEEAEVEVDDDRMSEGLGAAAGDGSDSVVGAETGAGADVEGGRRLVRMLMSAEMSSMSISDWASLAGCGASVSAAMAVLVVNVGQWQGRGSVEMTGGNSW